MTTNDCFIFEHSPMEHDPFRLASSLPPILHPPLGANASTASFYSSCSNSDIFDKQISTESEPQPQPDCKFEIVEAIVDFVSSQSTPNTPIQESKTIMPSLTIKLRSRISTIDMSQNTPSYLSPTQPAASTIPTPNTLSKIGEETATPTFPDTKEEEETETETEAKEIIKPTLPPIKTDALTRHGYRQHKILTRTLQGVVMEVFRADSNSNETFIVKRTNKDLHRRGVTIKKGRSVRVRENIVLEAKIMKFLQDSSPPSAMVGYVDFFEDKCDYYLVMEHGGADYFDFIVEAHGYIAEGKLSLYEWRKHVKHMFAQMVQFVHWMHNKMHCCHLDISLENMLIDKGASFNRNTGQLTECHVKFIDFGLAQFFDTKKNPKFKCRKFVGKQHYKSPQIYDRKGAFDARKADIWSLGVCLFMMISGSPPYKRPSMGDIGYNEYISKAKIAHLMKEWKRLQYLTSNVCDLLTKMLTVDEHERIDINELVQHPWIRQYFPDSNSNSNSNQNMMTNRSHNSIDHIAAISGGASATVENEIVTRYTAKFKRSNVQSPLPTISNSNTEVARAMRCSSLSYAKPGCSVSPSHPHSHSDQNPRWEQKQKQKKQKRKQKRKQKQQKGKRKQSKTGRSRVATGGSFSRSRNNKKSRSAKPAKTKKKNTGKKKSKMKNFKSWFGNNTNSSKNIHNKNKYNKV